MKKNTFRFIVIMMSISLLGLIGLQVIWISNAYELKQKEFDNAVNNSLNKLTEQIENIENSKLAKTQLYKIFDDGIETIDKKIELSDSSINIESDIRITSSPPLEVLKKLDSMGTNKSQGVMVIRDDKELGKLEELEKLSELKKLKGLNKINPNDAEFFDTHGNRIEIDSLNAKEKIEKVKKAFVRVVTEITTETPTISERIAAVNIDSLLTISLTTEDIDIKPNVLIKTKDSNFYNDGINTLNKLYTAKLFPNDISENDASISLQFANSSNYALKRIGSLLAASLVFTLIIIITFYISLKTLLKQKKISEIKSDFINNMTHEFKTPISTISLAAESINQPQIIADKEKVTYYTGVIKQENDRMLAQVENILQISLLDKQQLNLNKENVNLHELIDKAISNIALQINKAEATINKAYHAHTATIKGDELHLVNVLTNLLDNALKYNNGKPTIDISTNNTVNTIQISFKDNGIGMKEDTQKRVFDKFYRAHTGDIHNVKGFGLGLSYVKAIIEAHGATIKAVSSFGKGSEFIVTLPINE